MEGVLGVEREKKKKVNAAMIASAWNMYFNIGGADIYCRHPDRAVKFYVALKPPICLRSAGIKIVERINARAPRSSSLVEHGFNKASGKNTDPSSDATIFESTPRYIGDH